jgi:hypothetical protein
MKITLPHWAAIVVIGLGAFLIGLASVPSLSDWGKVLVSLGGSLIAAGTTGVLSLPAAGPFAKKVLAIACFVAFSPYVLGCLPSAPIVPVTQANQAQVSTCQSIAATHNGIQVGDLILTGTVPVIAGIAAAEPSTNASAKTDLAISAAIVGGAAMITSGLVAYTATDFAGSNCGSVVGSLPVVPALSALDGGVTVVVPEAGDAGAVDAGGQ